MRKLPRTIRPGLHLAKGFGLIELMISMAIAAFLVLGLATMMANMQSTYTVQTNNSAVADKQRYASAFLSNLIQSAGYYSLVLSGQYGIRTHQTSLLPETETAPGVNYFVRQAISGVTGTSGAPDQLNLRYQANPGDFNGITCLGTSPDNGIYESVLSVDTVNNNLICQVGINGGTPAATPGGTAGTSMVLIDGVSNMQVQYGVETYTGANGTPQLQYYKASAMTNATWPYVVSIRVTLYFTNPSNPTATPQSFSEVYQVMYNASTNN